MRKRTLLIPVLLFIAISGCQTSDTSTISSAGASGDYVDVTITGVTCFYLEQDAQTGKQINPVLLVLKDPNNSHVPTLTLSATSGNDLYNAIGIADCTTAACPLGNYRISVTDNGAPLAGDFARSTQFDTYILHLKNEANPSFSDFNTYDDVTKPPGGPVLAVLDLHGGEVKNARPFAGNAHFDTRKCNTQDIPQKQFARSVTVRFKTTNKPALAFVVGVNDSRVVNFANAGSQKMGLSNLADLSKPHAIGSHMYLFSQLSASNICLPEVIPGSSPSLDHDYVAGCGNSTYP